MKTPLIAANWKMNKSPALARRYFEEFLEAASEEEQERTVFFVPALCLEAAADCLEGSPITFGAQNCWTEDKGAFTGENSPAVIKDIGCECVLVGHSERRQYFGESEKVFSEKIAAIHNNKMAPMYCIGESLEEREAGKQEQVWKRQLHEALANIDLTKEISVAYEPVWAIGTGKVASSEQVAEAHKAIRGMLTEMHNGGWADKIPLLYGGSVKGANAGELSQIPDVNGFLVGGASLEVGSFLEIHRAVLSN